MFVAREKTQFRYSINCLNFEGCNLDKKCNADWDFQFAYFHYGGYLENTF